MGVCVYVLGGGGILSWAGLATKLERENTKWPGISLRGQRGKMGQPSCGLTSCKRYHRGWVQCAC